MLFPLFDPSKELKEVGEQKEKIECEDYEVYFIENLGIIHEFLSVVPQNLYLELIMSSIPLKKIR